jgi:tRNA(Ile2)-agmatinylcytidine synthase
LHIGFDDTDSLKGNCTTYLATKIIEKIYDKVTFLDYPRLIRNNPNVPWRTRGNGAIAFTLDVKEEDLKEIISLSIDIIEENHQEDPNTNPGFAAIKGSIPLDLKEFAQRALTDVISINDAKKVAKKLCLEYHLIGNGRGIIGALAAIGNTLSPQEEDFTFELLTYRISSSIGTKRKVDFESIKKMDRELAPLVFNNIDEETGKAIICPAGPDPVLYGIRGEKAEVLLRAIEIVQINEPIEAYCIFRTNQGTDQHFKYSTSAIRNFNTFKGEIEVIDPPRTLVGGHIIFKAKVTETSKIVDVAAFEPSKSFRRTIEKLMTGDKILAYGSVRHKKEFQSFTIQLEKCEIISISNQFKEESPFCPECGKRLTSDGKEKGYKCRKCGYKNRYISKLLIPIQREIQLGVYIPPAQAQRHLVKPSIRYNLPSKDSFDFVTNWWKKYSSK